MYVKHHNAHSREPSNNLAQSTMSILFTDTHTHTNTHTHTCSLITCNRSPWLAYAIVFFPLHNKSRTHKKKASCGTRPRGVAHKIHLTQNLHKLMQSRPALPLLIMLTWLYVTRLTRPNKIFSPLTTPYHAYHDAQTYKTK